jgi:hypothetical protein
MIVKINGKSLEMTYPNLSHEVIEPISKKDYKNLKKLAVTLWTLSGTMLMKSAHAGTFYQEMKPLYVVFQEFALGFGALALIIGLIVFAFKKRVGKSIVVVTGLVIAGVFFVPSILMLLAIIGTMVDSALYDALQGIRGVEDVKGVFNSNE